MVWVLELKNKMNKDKFDLDFWILAYQNHFDTLLENEMDDDLYIMLVQLDVKINKYIHSLKIS